MPVAGIVALPAAFSSVLHAVTWPLLAAMLALAALHPVLPFSLEFLALRRLTARTFGTLMSLEPAIALLAGLLILGQIPSAAATAGILFVIIAGIGATRAGARTPQPHDHRDATPAPARGASQAANQPARPNPRSTGKVMVMRLQAAHAELAGRPVKEAGRRLHAISQEVRMCRRSVTPADSASSQKTGY